MTFDDELILIKETIEQDELKNEIATETEIPILCSVKSVSRSEFYSAAQNGLKPSKVFVINKLEYGEEELVLFEGDKYKVIKAYEIDAEYTELTCERL